MRYALIDNSTLTGVQRLLGEIPVKNNAIIDNDIASFENYIQSILFYDQIICIDDYKKRYREKRKKYFPQIRFIPTDLFKYDSFVKTANDVTKDISLKISAGQISDADFKDYFDRLNMTFRFTWDISGSRYFLTQKMLQSESIVDIDTFNAIHAQLFKENNEEHEVQSSLVNKFPTLYDSRGNKIEINPETGAIEDTFQGDGLSSQLHSMIASLNWMSQRTAFYVLCADYLYADLFIQPIRQEFLQNIIRRVYPNYKLGVFGDFRNSLNNQSEDTIKKVIANSDNYGISVDIPLFSAYFAHKTSNSKSIIEAAYNEREEKHFREARNQLRELNQILDGGNRSKFIREINLLANSINETFKQIENKYGLGEKQGFGISQLKFLFSYIPLIKDVDVPKEFDSRLKQLEFLKHLRPKKGLNAVYRNVIEDLFVISSLGKYKDILIGNIDTGKHGGYYTGIKYGDDQYLDEDGWWNKKM